MRFTLSDLLAPHYCCSCGEIGAILCDYCKYKSICGFDTGNPNNHYNYISEMEKNAVLEMIAEENIKD